MTRFLPLLLLLSPGLARAAGPVVVAVRAQASVGTAAVTVGDVAVVTGGDPAARDRVARLDVVELKTRDAAVTLTRRSVEYRVRLAGLDGADVLVTGAERVTLTPARRPVTADEVIAVARAELLRRLPGPADGVSAEPLAPIAVRLPEVLAGETPTITAVPRGRAVGLGRNQMDVTIACGGEKLLSFGVLFEVKAVGAGGVIPAGGAAAVPGTPAARPEVVVKPRDRVTMVVKLGASTVSAVGEAQQGGAVGQVIPVQNVDSKKVISARITGPGIVEVDLPRTP